MSRNWPTEDDGEDTTTRVVVSKLKSGLSARKRDRDEITNDKLENKKRKANKPQELQANKPVSRLNASSISGITIKKVGQDPRFQEGTTRDGQLFKSAYKFLDEIQEKEAVVLAQKAKEETDADKKEAYSNRALQINKQLEKRLKDKKADSLFLEYKSKERDLVSQGKIPFYLKKSDIRQLGAASQFLELEQKGKVDSFIAKKRAKAASKDKRYMPADQ